MAVRMLDPFSLGSGIVIPSEESNVARTESAWASSQAYTQAFAFEGARLHQDCLVIMPEREVRDRSNFRH